MGLNTGIHSTTNPNYLSASNLSRNVSPFTFRGVKVLANLSSSDRILNSPTFNVDQINADSELSINLVNMDRANEVCFSLICNSILNCVKIDKVGLQNISPNSSQVLHFDLESQRNVNSVEVHQNSYNIVLECLFVWTTLGLLHVCRPYIFNKLQLVILKIPLLNTFKACMTQLMRVLGCGLVD
jgi:hypothetical protein